MTQEIYILTHKKIEYDLDTSNYMPIHVGAELSNEYVCDIKDNTGDNISNKNEYYLETTGIYWIYKNSKADIKGQMQYRRFLSINPNLIQVVLNSYDIILPNPIVFKMTILKQYEIFHNIDDILAIREILLDLYPEYVYSYDKYIKNSNILYYSNSFIANNNIYDDLCSFVFSVLNAFENKYKYYDKDIRLKHAEETIKLYSKYKTLSFRHKDIDQVQYQTRFCGALFERLVTLYVFHNKLNVYHCGRYITMEEKMKM